MPIKAIQQFQLGTVLNNENQAAATLARLRGAGYAGIELCGFMLQPTPLAVRLLTRAAGMPVGRGGCLDWPKLIKAAGLQVPGIHQYLGAIEENPQLLVAQAAGFGAKYIIVTGMYRFDYGDAAAVHGLAARLNRAGAALAQQGVQLLYHNHNAEFQRCEEGKTAYDILLEETDPALVNFELDTYWAADAGVDVSALMGRLGPRLRLWHINDRAPLRPKNTVTPILRQDSAELGCGNLPLDTLMHTALAAGVDAVILESHRNWTEGDPVKSAEKSAAFLNRYL